MNHYLKTSGASGFHIFLPLEFPNTPTNKRAPSPRSSRRIVSAANPKLTTSERTVSKRPDGRIMIDALQNARGKPLACVYSVRAFPKATVSTPLFPRSSRPNSMSKNGTCETSTTASTMLAISGRTSGKNAKPSTAASTC